MFLQKKSIYVLLTVCTASLGAYAMEELIVPQVSAYATFNAYVAACKNSYDEKLQKTFNQACQQLEPKQKNYKKAGILFKDAAEHGHKLAGHIMARHALTDRYELLQERFEIPKIFTETFNKDVHLGRLQRCLFYLNGNDFLPAQFLCSKVNEWSGDYLWSDVFLHASLREIPLEVYDKQKNQNLYVKYVNKEALKELYNRHLAWEEFGEASGVLSTLCQLDYAAWGPKLKLFRLQQGKMIYTGEMPNYQLSAVKHQQSEQVQVKKNKAPAESVNSINQTQSNVARVEMPVNGNQQQKSHAAAEPTKQDDFKLPSDYVKLRTFIEDEGKKNYQKALGYLSQLDADTICEKAGLGWQYLYYSGLQNNDAAMNAPLLQECIQRLSIKSNVTEDDIIWIQGLDDLSSANFLRREVAYNELLHKTFIQLKEVKKAEAYRVIDEPIVQHKEQTVSPVQLAELWMRAKVDKNVSGQQLMELAQQILSADYALQTIAADARAKVIASYLESAIHTKRTVPDSFFDAINIASKKPLSGSNLLKPAIKEAQKKGVLTNPIAIRNLYIATGQYDEAFVITKRLFQDGHILDTWVIDTLKQDQLMQIIELVNAKDGSHKAVDDTRKQLIRNKVLSLLDAAKDNCVINHANIVKRFVELNKQDSQLLSKYVKALSTNNKKVDSAIMQALIKIDAQLLGTFLLENIHNKQLMTWCVEPMSDALLDTLNSCSTDLFKEGTYFCQQNKVQFWQLKAFHKNNEWQKFFNKSSALKQNRDYAKLVSDIEKLQKTALVGLNNPQAIFDSYSILQKNNDIVWVDHFVQYPIEKLDENSLKPFLQACKNNDLSVWFSCLQFDQIAQQGKAFERVTQWLDAAHEQKLIENKQLIDLIAPIFPLLQERIGSDWSRFSCDEHCSRATRTIASWVLSYGKYTQMPEHKQKAYYLLKYDSQFDQQRTYYISEFLNAHAQTKTDEKKSMIEHEIKKGNQYAILYCLFNRTTDESFDKQGVLYNTALEKLVSYVQKGFCVDSTTNTQVALRKEPTNVVFKQLLYAYVLKLCVTKHEETWHLAVAGQDLKQMGQQFEKDIDEWERGETTEQIRAQIGRAILAFLNDDMPMAEKHCMKILTESTDNFYSACAQGILANLHDNNFTKPVDGALVERIRKFFDEQKIVSPHLNGLEYYYMHCLQGGAQRALMNLYDNFDSILNKDVVGAQLYDMARTVIGQMSEDSLDREIYSYLRLICRLQNMYTKHEKVFNEQSGITCDDIAALLHDMTIQLKKYKGEEFAEYAKKMYQVGCTVISPSRYDHMTNKALKSAVITDNIASIRAYLEQFNAKELGFEQVGVGVLSNVHIIQARGKKMNLAKQINQLGACSEARETCDVALGKLYDNVRYYCDQCEESIEIKNEKIKDSISFLINKYPTSWHAAALIKELYFDTHSCVCNATLGADLLERCRVKGNIYAQQLPGNFPPLEGNEESFVAYLINEFSHTADASYGSKEKKYIRELIDKEKENLIASFTGALISLNNTKMRENLTKGATNVDEALVLHGVLQGVMGYIKSRQYALGETEIRLWNAKGQEICCILEKLSTEQLMETTRQTINFILCMCYAQRYQALKDKMKNLLEVGNESWKLVGYELNQMSNQFEAKIQDLRQNRCVEDALLVAMNFITGKKTVNELREELNLLKNKNHNFIAQVDRYPYLATCLAAIALAKPN